MQEFKGLEYVLIDIANQFGHDKLIWDERIEYARDIVTGSQVTLDLEIANADKPILMRKAVNAYRDAMNGTPTGYVMGLDATASGLQVMGAVIGCHQTAENVNLIKTGKREDIYQKVADVMQPMVTMVINKKVVKKPVMTTFYNSTAQPKSVFGEDTPELQAFYDTLHQLLPGAMEVKADIQGCWDSNALFHHWTLPDGHVAHVKIMDAVDKKIEIDELNHATFHHRIKVNMMMDYGLSLVANVVHSIDAYVVREMVRRASYQGFGLLTVHDEFKAAPNWMNHVRYNYRAILAEIADSDIMGRILREITHTNHPYNKKSTNLGALIRESEYALS